MTLPSLPLRSNSPDAGGIAHFVLPLVDAAHRCAYRLGHPLMRQLWRLTRPRARGAAVAVRCGGKLLVVRQSFRKGLGLPAGAIDNGETPRAAAVRELMEEVGIAVRPEDLVQVGEQHMRLEHRQVTTTLFELDLERPPLPRIDRREIVWAGWVDPDKLDGRELQPALRHYRCQLPDLRADPNRGSRRSKVRTTAEQPGL